MTRGPLACRALERGTRSGKRLRRASEALLADNSIRRFRAGGGSVFWVSHRLHEILALSDRITVLLDGRAIG